MTKHFKLDDDLMQVQAGCMDAGVRAVATQLAQVGVGGLESALAQLTRIRMLIQETQSAIDADEDEPKGDPKKK